MVQLQRSSPYSYRKKLLPNPREEFLCFVQAPPQPPTIVRDLSVSNVSHVDNNDDLFEFEISWVEPEFSNGDLKNYELIILLEGNPDGSDSEGTADQNVVLLDRILPVRESDIPVILIMVGWGKGGSLKMFK